MSRLDDLIAERDKRSAESPRAKLERLRSQKAASLSSLSEGQSTPQQDYEARTSEAQSLERLGGTVEEPMFSESGERIGTRSTDPRGVITEHTRDGGAKVVNQDHVDRMLFERQGGKAYPELGATTMGFEGIGGAIKQQGVQAAMLLSADPNEQAQIANNLIEGSKLKTLNDGSILLTWEDEEGKEVGGVINRPGMSQQDINTAISQIAQFAPAARLTAMGKTIFKRFFIGAAASNVTAEASEQIQKATGGTRDQADINLATVLGPADAAVKTVARTVKDVARPFSKSGRESIIGETLRREAKDKARALENLKKADTGIDQTAGVKSLDPGLLGMEKAARAIDRSSGFAEKLSKQNAQRQGILDIFTSKSKKSLKQERKAETGPMREKAIADAGTVSQEGVFDKLSEILAGDESGLTVVNSAMKFVRNRLADIMGFKRVKSVVAGKSVTKSGRTFETKAGALYALRKDIGKMISGKLKGEQGDFIAAKIELEKIQKSIDAAIGEGNPGWREYLDKYRKMTQNIKDIDIVRKIQREAVKKIIDPITGNDLLDQGKLRKMFREEQDLDRLPDDVLKVIGKLSKDMDEIASMGMEGIKAAGMTPDASVFQQAQREIARNAIERTAVNVVHPKRWFMRLNEKQLNDVLVAAILDPDMSARLMSEATPASMTQFDNALRQFSDAYFQGAQRTSIQGSRESKNEE